MAMLDMFRAAAGVIVASAVTRHGAARTCLVIGLVLVTACSSAQPETSIIESKPSTPSERASAPASGVAGPEVPSIAACKLLADAEIEEAMGLLEIPWVERILLTYSGGEGCTWRHVRDGTDVEGLSISISPGAPEDFNPDAELEGVQGMPVQGIGRAAVWFGGPEGGDLSIVERASVGYLLVRVGVDRPDLDDPGRLGVARRLAAAALARFPGMEAPSEPLSVTVDHQPTDRAGASLDDNLTARLAAGEWTLGDGLAETLRLFTGEADATDVLRDPALVSGDGTGILRRASEYLAAEPNGPASAEIVGLLDRIVFSDERLLEMAGSGPATAALFPPVTTFTAQAEACASFFEGSGTTPGVGPCLEWRPANVPPGEDPDKYRVFVPAKSLPQGGWTEADFDNALTALEHSVAILDGYQGVGKMPPVNIVFSVSPYSPALAWAATPGGGKACGVAVFPAIQKETVRHFMQTIAHELVHCLTAETFPAQTLVGYDITKWWEEGVAEYLSNVVFPTYNLEHFTLPELVRTELGSTVVTSRSYENAAFFQHLAWFIEDSGIMDLLGSLPGCPASGTPCPARGWSAQEAALAAVSGMADLYHLYVTLLTDASIEDTGGGLLPYLPESQPVPIAGPTGILDLPPPFGSTRLHLKVAAGQYACLEYDQAGDLKSSWRKGPPGRRGAGDWSDELPDVLDGEATVVATATAEDASFRLTVSDVVDEPKDCDEAASPSPADCGLCGPSRYFRFIEALPPSLRSELGAFTGR